MREAIFETKRMICRRWLPQDFETLYRVYSDPEAMRWVGDGQPISVEQCEQWFKVTAANYVKRGYGMFTLVERASSQVVGFCGLVHPEEQVEAEIKYAFLRSCWGNGMASEAVPSLLAYGFSHHMLDRIVATVAAGNHASQRILLKAGMRLEHRRENGDGSVTCVYALNARRTRNRLSQC